MKDRSKFTSPTARVYYINKANQPIIDQATKVAYDKNKEFALVYSESDIIHIDKVLEAEWNEQQAQKRSYEDEIYEFFLEETGVEAPKILPNHHLVLSVDTNTEMIVDFESSENVPFITLIRKLDAIKGGSEVIFLIGSSESDENTVGLYVDIDEA
ncbi:hypothetical protein N7548_00160 [Acholeplasma manati]|uniref:Uncharacterized protein n=1 Tax=Paracholeplasma manati TaxID=591373 RepID=A0ABT2Y456_9MOLU|nr:hypothetical protein [Paracholeplasma manati]MCV2231238.1 hypothetical protein [Paracholeplasma manati]